MGKFKNESGEEARKMKDILDSKNDPNVYVIAEIAIGLNPKVEIKGVLAEDEEVLGAMIKQKNIIIYSSLPL